MTKRFDTLEETDASEKLDAAVENPKAATEKEPGNGVETLDDLKKFGEETREKVSERAVELVTSGTQGYESIKSSVDGSQAFVQEVETKTRTPEKLSEKQGKAEEISSNTQEKITKLVSDETGVTNGSKEKPSLRVVEDPDAEVRGNRFEEKRRAKRNAESHVEKRDAAKQAAEDAAFDNAFKSGIEAKRAEATAKTEEAEYIEKFEDDWKKLDAARKETARENAEKNQAREQYEKMQAMKTMTNEELEAEWKAKGGRDLEGERKNAQSEKDKADYEKMQKMKTMTDEELKAEWKARGGRDIEGEGETNKGNFEKAPAENPENKEQGIEALKARMEAAQAALLEAYKNEAQAKKNVGVFGRAVGKVFGRQGSAWEDLNAREQELAQAMAVFREAHNAYGNEMIKDRRSALENSLAEQGLKKGTPEYKKAFDDRFKTEVLTAKIFESKVVGSDGNEMIVQKSAFEDWNDRLKSINQERMAALEGKKKGIAGKLFDRYKKMSKGQRMAASVILAGTIGATLSLAGGAGVAAALGYGAWKAGGAFLRGAIGAGVSAAVERGMKGWQERKNEKSGLTEDIYKAKSEAEAEGILNKALKNENEQTNWMETIKQSEEKKIEVMDTYNREKAKQARNRIIASGLTGAGVSFLAMNWDSIAHAADLKGAGVGKTAEAGVVGKPPETVPGSTAEQLKFKSSLHKGDNVWKELQEYNKGNAQETAKQLAEFKKAATEQLAKQGMNADQANKYMEWKFRHLPVGQEVSVDANGKLSVPGFTDQNEIARFNKSGYHPGGGSAHETGVRRPRTGVRIGQIDPKDGKMRISAKDFDDFQKIAGEHHQDVVAGHSRQEILNAVERQSGKNADAIRSSQNIINDIGFDPDEKALYTRRIPLKDLLAVKGYESFNPAGGGKAALEGQYAGALRDPAEQKKIIDFARQLRSYNPSPGDMNLTAEQFLQKKWGVRNLNDFQHHLEAQQRTAPAPSSREFHEPLGGNKNMPKPGNVPERFVNKGQADLAAASERPLSAREAAALEAAELDDEGPEGEDGSSAPLINENDRIKNQIARMQQDQARQSVLAHAEHDRLARRPELMNNTGFRDFHDGAGRFGLNPHEENMTRNMRVSQILNQPRPSVPHWRPGMPVPPGTPPQLATQMKLSNLADYVRRVNPNGIERNMTLDQFFKGRG